MKLTLRLLCLVVICLLAETSSAQCGAGYTQAQLNWDYLDYYYSTPNAAPYGNGGASYVSTTMEQTQKFAIGTNSVTIAVSAAGVVKGENLTHTGDLPGYTGADAQFTPGNSQTITLTFATEVMNASFTLYDIDGSAVFNLSAANATPSPLNVNVATQTGTTLTVVGSGGTAPSITGGLTNLTNSDNSGSATITVNGPVKTITISIVTAGTDATFWMSDINACVTGSFPSNYHQMASEKPFAGQPSYFLTTDDDKYVYMIDPTTGKATYLFSETQFTNSFAYDQVHHVLYYVLDGSSTANAVKANKTLKKYDFNTESSSVVISDITAAPLNIPTFDGGIESAGACYYNGDLYLGIEGGSYNSTNTRETIVYRLTLNSSGVPTSAAQVYATPAIDVAAASNDQSIHDWGDFFVKDGVLIDFNTARNNPTGSAYTYDNQDFVHFNLMTGQVDHDYINPTPTQVYVGQAGMDWAGNLYSIWTDKGNNTVGIKKYNMDGTLGSNVSISVTGKSPLWKGGSGDASEPFRPKVDFGDAPASYDPASGDPAVHAIDSNLYIGTSFDKEFVTRGQTALANSDNLDDGLTTVPIFVSSSFSYQANVKVMNKTGANATLVAWLDFNGNGVFDPSEGIVKTVANNASAQTISLFWPSPTAYSTLQTGAYTYLRIRITYATNSMTVNTPTGYFNSGEVEDYRVVVNSYPLATTLHTFDAALDVNKTVQLKWNIDDESNIESYTIEKSSNSKNWDLVTSLLSKNGTGLVNYESTDNSPLPGTSYYRLRILKKDGKTQFSDLKRVDINLTSPILIAPNPAIDKASVYVNSNVRKQATLQIINAQGAVVHNQNITLNAGANTIELPVATKLNSGRYMVRITTDQNTISQSLIVNK